MNKKILFVNSALTFGGAEKVMTILANEFSKKDYEVNMVLVRESEKENYKLEKKIKCMKINYKKRSKLLKLIERIIFLRDIIKNNHYDCVISFTYGINTSVLIASMGLKTPIIVSERCDPASRKLNKLIRKIEDRLYENAQTIVLQTEQVKKQYPKFLQKKFVVIPNPISDNIIMPFEGEREHKIVAAGRLTAQKNFDMLIDAFYEINKKYDDYQLYIYGEGPLRDQLLTKIHELNLEEKVFLPGYVDNVNELMQKAKLYISTSNFEGISNSMLEAMAMGIPTICTDCPVGGAAMMIEDNVNGILIPVGDTESLVQSIDKILSDTEIEKRLSQNAILIKDRLNIKNIIKEWEKLVP